MTGIPRQVIFLGTPLGTSTAVSTVLDLIGSTQGSLLYRGASAWSALTPGTAGKVLSSNGTGANPEWVTVSGTGTAATETQVLQQTSSTTFVTPEAMAIVTRQIATSAKAPGLVFDGTAGATVSGVPAFGTGDFTIVAWVNPVVQVNNAGVAGASDNNFYAILNGAGKLETTKVTSTTAGTIGQNTCWAIVRGSSLQTIYKDGIADSSATADATNYTTAWNEIGANTSFGTKLNGTLRVQIYNRALSAAEVKSLYESGPSGADYNESQVNGTGLVTGDNSTFASDTGFWTKSGATISGGVCALAANGDYISKTNLLVVGKRYRVTLNVSAYTALMIAGSSTGNGYIEITSTGAKSGEFTATNTTFSIYTNGAATFDDVTLTPLGLVLAPDYTVGSGLTVPPQNGTNGTITLPASGVSWSQPNGNLISLGTVAANQATIAGDANGGLVVTPKAGQSVSAVTSYNGGTLGFNATNANSGTAAVAGYKITGDANVSVLQAYSTGYTTSTFNVQGSLLAYHNGAGGIGFAADHASGAFRWYPGASPTAKMVLDANGNLTAAGTGSHVFGTTNTVTLAAGAVTATGAVTGQSGLVAGNGINVVPTVTLLTQTSDAASRGWRLRNDNVAYGDFAIQQETTQGGGTFANKLLLSPTGNATFAGSVAATTNKSAGNWQSEATLVLAGSATGTVFTFDNANANRVYLVTVRQDGGASNYAIAMVITYGASASVTRMAQDNTNPALTLDFSFSGLALQLTPGSGYGSTTWKAHATPLAN